MKEKIFSKIMDVKSNFSYQTEEAVKDINELNKLISKTDYKFKKINIDSVNIESELNSLLDDLEKIVNLF